MARMVSATTRIALAALVLMAPLAVRADADEARYQALEDRLRALEDKLVESQSVIEAQRDMLKKQASDTASDNDVAQGGALDGFLSSVEVGGHVATSYLYSFNNPVTNAATQGFCQFNCRTNEFSLDAVKFEIGKSASEPGSVGFQFDILYGENAAIFTGAGGTQASDFTFFIQQAYAAYNLNGVELKFGKFETLLGYELIDSNDNFQVTQSILFTFAIPLFHTGVLASGSLTEELSWAAGITNGFNNVQDTDDDKGFLGQLAYESGPIFASWSVYYGNLGETRPSGSAGATVGDNNVDTLMNDIILQYSPSDSLTTYVNVDFGKTERRPASSPGLPNGTDPQFFGVALGFKQQLSEKLYFSARGEYMNDDEGSRFGVARDEVDAYSGTFTLGYQLNDNLLARLEYRRDHIDCDDASCNGLFFVDSSGGGEETNDLGIVEVVYSFD